MLPNEEKNESFEETAAQGSLALVRQEEFTQQDIKHCLAEIVLLVQRRRPLTMVLREIETKKGKLFANAVRKELEIAEQKKLFV